MIQAWVAVIGTRCDDHGDASGNRLKGLIGRVCVFNPATQVSVNLCDGIGLTPPAETLKYGTLVFELFRIECSPIAAQIAKGMCVRIHIAAGMAHVPRYDVCYLIVKTWSRHGSKHYRSLCL